MLEKLKLLLTEDALFYTLLIILIAVASFGLGRKSIELDSKAVNPTGNNQALAAISSLEATPKILEKEGSGTASQIKVIASRSGSKYHLPDCPGAQQIKPENRVEFESIEAAKTAGLTPAANCPGL